MDCHSVIRRNTEKFDNVKSTKDTANSTSLSGFLSDFIQSFVPHYQQGQSDPYNIIVVYC